MNSGLRLTAQWRSLYRAATALPPAPICQSCAVSRRAYSTPTKDTHEASDAAEADHTAEPIVPWYLRSTSELAQDSFEQVYSRGVESLPELPKNASPELKRVTEFLVREQRAQDVRVYERDTKDSDLQIGYIEPAAVLVGSLRSSAQLLAVSKALRTFYKRELRTVPRVLGMSSLVSAKVQRRRAAKKLGRRPSTVPSPGPQWISVCSESVVAHLFTQDGRDAWDLDEVLSGEHLSEEQAFAPEIDLLAPARVPKQTREYSTMALRPDEKQGVRLRLVDPDGRFRPFARKPAASQPLMEHTDFISCLDELRMARREGVAPADTCLARVRTILDSGSYARATQLMQANEDCVSAHAVLSCHLFHLQSLTHDCKEDEDEGRAVMDSFMQTFSSQTDPDWDAWRLRIQCAALCNYLWTKAFPAREVLAILDEAESRGLTVPLSVYYMAMDAVSVSMFPEAGTPSMHQRRKLTDSRLELIINVLERIEFDAHTDKRDAYSARVFVALYRACMPEIGSLQAMSLREDSTPRRKHLYDSRAFAVEDTMAHFNVPWTGAMLSVAMGGLARAQCFDAVYRRFRHLRYGGVATPPAMWAMLFALVADSGDVKAAVHALDYWYNDMCRDPSVVVSNSDKTTPQLNMTTELANSLDSLVRLVDPQGQMTGYQRIQKQIQDHVPQKELSEAASMLQEKDHVSRQSSLLQQLNRLGVTEKAGAEENTKREDDWSSVGLEKHQNTVYMEGKNGPSRGRQRKIRQQRQRGDAA